LFSDSDECSGGGEGSALLLLPEASTRWCDKENRVAQPPSAVRSHSSRSEAHDKTLCGSRETAAVQIPRLRLQSDLRFKSEPGFVSGWCLAKGKGSLSRTSIGMTNRALCSSPRSKIFAPRTFLHPRHSIPSRSRNLFSDSDECSGGGEGSALLLLPEASTRWCDKENRVAQPPSAVRKLGPITRDHGDVGDHAILRSRQLLISSSGAARLRSRPSHRPAQVLPGRLAENE